MIREEEPIDVETIKVEMNLPVGMVIRGIRRQSRRIHYLYGFYVNA